MRDDEPGDQRVKMKIQIKPPDQLRIHGEKCLCVVGDIAAFRNGEIMDAVKSSPRPEKRDVPSLGDQPLEIGIGEDEADRTGRNKSDDEERDAPDKECFQQTAHSNQREKTDSYTASVILAVRFQVK